MCRMFSFTRFAWFGLGCWLIASMAQAQQSPGGDPDEMFRQLDANKDGKLTLSEGGPGSQQFLRRLFEMANKKESDSISRDELRRLAEQHRRSSTGGNQNSVGNRPNSRSSSDPASNQTVGSEGRDELPNLLRVLDTNYAGQLSRSELSRLVERFNDWDRNHDGQLGLAELQSIERESGERRVSDEPVMNDPSRRPATSVPNRSGNNATSGTNARRPTTSGPTSSTLQLRLAGTWRGWVVDGRGENPNAGHMQMELRVEGNRMFGKEVGTSRSPEGLGDGTFAVAGSGSSGTLDAVSTSGQHNGREYPGIFEIEGDTLRWCVNNRNGTRPTAFETNRGNYFMILRRQK